MDVLSPWFFAAAFALLALAFVLIALGQHEIAAVKRRLERLEVGSVPPERSVPHHYAEQVRRTTTKTGS